MIILHDDTIAPEPVPATVTPATSGNKKTSPIIWLVLLIVVAAALFILFNALNKKKDGSN